MLSPWRSAARRHLPPPRLLGTCPTVYGWRDKFVMESDLNKRPSALEIERKQLPANTPTLGERIRRDRHHLFHEWDKKGGYYRGRTGTWRDRVENKTTADVLKDSYNFIRDGVKMYTQEEMIPNMTDPYRVKPDWGQTKIEWEFGEEDSVEKQWKHTCDSDWGEGYSSCSLERSSDGRACVFSGQLSTRVPQDGRIFKAGYCNMASMPRYKSFKRLKEFHWEFYTHLYLWVRGDGRTYKVNLHTPGPFDVMWQDLWMCHLFTRGGPYWQYVKIPFSKFFFTNRGYIQDSQHRVPLHWLKGISFTLADKIDGPFRLEVHKIGVGLAMPNEDEKFRYETYMLPSINFNRN